MTKYGAKRTEYNGRWYASKREAARAKELDLLIKAGEVVAWTPQPMYPLIVNKQKIGIYIADFRVHWKDGRCTVEDVKGMATPVYRLKKKLVKAIHGIDIEEK